ncbi:MAG: 4-hydroxy-3-methylbut-2-enyl diphosphate reductase [Bifidobacterium breve]|nr:4-hydroxy-3-methylbut-2-enyl diphosphate reductase [Bifidobacterium breve]
MTKSVVLADPRGFCAGVDRAILTVQTILKAAESSGKLHREDGLPPVYVRRQIVHNKHVVEDLAGQGAVFVQELSEIPDAAAAAGIPVVFSAHGVSPVVKSEAQRRGMHVVDATCPLVGKVHREVLRFVREGYEIVYIGHKGHDEAVGVVGESPEHVHLIEHESDVDSLDFAPDTKLVLLSQTTLSVDETAGTIAALKARFPCLGERGKAYRVDDANELDPSWFEGVESVGISSGASVPDELVSGVIDTLRNQGFTGMKSVETIKENMHFVLPAELRRKK